MYNYYADIIWKIDILFLALSLALAVIIIFNTVVRDYAWKRRSRALLEIKRHVYEMVLAGQGAASDKLGRYISAATPQQFLDVTTNRDRELIFFNDAERQAFKDYFISPKQTARLKKTAAFSWNKWRRIEAIMSLGYANINGAVDILKSALFTGDEDVSYFSMMALGHIKNKESARILIGLLKKRPLQSSKVVSLLEGFPDYVADDAAQLTYDSDPSIRLWALRLSSKFKIAKHIERILELTQDESPDVRAAACECLGKSGAKKTADALKKTLKDDSWLVRASAVKALSVLLGKDSVPFAADLISDGSLSVIMAVKNILIDNMAGAFPHIEKFFEGDNSMAKKVALEALEESGYIVKMLNTIASAGPEKEIRTRRLLEGIIETGAHRGMEEAIMAMDDGLRRKILDGINKINPALAEHIDKKIKGEIEE